MKILSEETKDGNPKLFIVIMDKREAQTLVDMSRAAWEANKRKRLFKTWMERFEELLCCY